MYTILPDIPTTSLTDKKNPKTVKAVGCYKFILFIVLYYFIFFF